MISVIIPVYRAEATLSRCVESLLSQTEQDFELLLVDDGSPDRSGEICDAYAKKDARVRVIHQKNAGASAARNRGMDEARGDFFAFVDSDDFVAPAYLEELLALLQKSNADISMCNYTLLSPDEKTSVVEHGFEDGTFLSEKDVKNIFYRRIIDGNTGGFFSLCNKLFRRDLIEKNHFRMNLAMSFGEDMTFLLDCFEASLGITFTDKPLYFYDLGDEGLFNRYRPSLLSDMMICYEKSLSTVSKYHPEEKKFVRLHCRYFYYINRYLDGIVKNEKKKAKAVSAVWAHPTVRKVFAAISALSADELSQNGISEYERKVPNLVLRGHRFLATEYLLYQTDETHILRKIKRCFSPKGE